MNKIFKISSYILAAAVSITSCQKITDYKAPYTVVSAGKAFIKVNYTVSYAANPGVQLKLNNERVSNLVTSRTPFPGGGYNTNGQNFPDYFPIDAGSVVLEGAIPRRNTNADSVVLFVSPLTLQANKRYTAHVADTAHKIKVVLLEDDITVPAPGNSKFRFVNLIPNVATGVDLYYGTTLVAAGIPYLGSSAYFTVPANSTANPAQAWDIRVGGSAANSPVLATYNSTNTVQDQRVYTAFAQGYSGVPTSDAVRRPYISFLLNY